jgi:hypothetical protein
MTISGAETDLDHGTHLKWPSPAITGPEVEAGGVSTPGLMVLPVLLTGPNELNEAVMNQSHDRTVLFCHVATFQPRFAACTSVFDLMFA